MEPSKWHTSQNLSESISSVNQKTHCLFMWASASHRHLISHYKTYIIALELMESQCFIIARHKHGDSRQFLKRDTLETVLKTYTSQPQGTMMSRRDDPHPLTTFSLVAHNNISQIPYRKIKMAHLDVIVQKHICMYLKLQATASLPRMRMYLVPYIFLILYDVRIMGLQLGQVLLILHRNKLFSYFI